MNLILIKDNYYVKELMEKFINVKLIMINYFIQLKYYNKLKEILILMKFKLYKILNKINI